MKFVYLLLVALYSQFFFATATNTENDSASSKLSSTITSEAQTYPAHPFNFLQRVKRTIFGQKSHLSPSRKMSYMRRILNHNRQNKNQLQQQNQSHFQQKKHQNHQNYYWNWHANRHYQPEHPSKTRPQHIPQSHTKWETNQKHQPLHPTTASIFTSYTRSPLLGYDQHKTTRKMIETISSTTSPLSTTTILPEKEYIFPIDIR